MSIKMIKCPSCGADNLEAARFCCMCGINIEEARKVEEQSMRNGTIPLVRRSFYTSDDKKTIEVYCHDITTFREDIDILTLSAFAWNYAPVRRTVIGALKANRGISVNRLAQKPYMDLRDSAGCWLSGEIPTPIPKIGEEMISTGENRSDESIEEPGKIGRIGCVEMRGRHRYRDQDGEASVLDDISAYFRLLDVAAVTGVKMDTIALPMLGAGNQGISARLVAIPLVSEAIAFLKRNPAVKKIIFINYNYETACLLADSVKDNYHLNELSERGKRKKTTGGAGRRRKNAYDGVDISDGTVSSSVGQDRAPYVFISYTTRGDEGAAELLCRILKGKGIDYWIASHEIHSGTYAGQIVKAIENCTHFICIISENSMQSEHVLNEIDLAFQHLEDGIVILPYRIDNKDKPLKPEFRYYLSRMQWNYGTPPPEEDRAREFIGTIFRQED